MSNITLIIVIVVAVVVIVAVVIVGYQMARKRRTAQLREQYGPEYDRAIDQAESQHEAESELRGRAKRHEQLELRSLDSSEREDFERRWSGTAPVRGRPNYCGAQRRPARSGGDVRPWLPGR